MLKAKRFQLRPIAKKDIKRKKNNESYLKSIQQSIKSLFKMKSGVKKTDQINKTVSHIDKGAKKKVIHKNKASRLKSRVMKLVSKKA